MSLPAFLRRHRRNIGIPLVFIALILSRFDQHYVIASIIFIIIGESIRIWAAGHLRKEEVLTTGGPYRFVRNPLYIGSFLIAIGFALISGSIWVWIIIVAYFLLVYVPVVLYEESVLRNKFPDFAEYASKVPRFIPAFHLYESTSTKFSFEQVLRNKEYNAILGIVVAYALIVIDSAYLK
ncbi:MAG TPA: isoprenylcysteine carboxylmethyltransferase family protein [Acidobacteriota bacterium]|nr:isoprenylcysteine carboxylmethyltransferase family protein [Acidobacteriota bacterium]